MCRFLPMGPELWDRNRTRLTLLLEVGYPLEEGVPVLVRVSRRPRGVSSIRSR